MDLSERIWRLIKSVAEEPLKEFDYFSEKSKIEIDRILSEWERAAAERANQYGQNGTRNSESKSYNRTETRGGEQHNQRYDRSETGSHKKAIPKYEEDLAIFGLHAPSSLAEVKKARNREIKKFHPDRFMNDPEKLQTAQQILQIYNEVYERLEKHYKGKRG